MRCINGMRARYDQSVLCCINFGHNTPMYIAICYWLHKYIFMYITSSYQLWELTIHCALIKNISQINYFNYTHPFIMRMAFFSPQLFDPMMVWSAKNIITVSLGNGDSPGSSNTSEAPCILCALIYFVNIFLLPWHAYLTLVKICVLS